jgi:hypothetical protein
MVDQGRRKPQSRRAGTCPAGEGQGGAPPGRGQEAGAGGDGQGQKGQELFGRRERGGGLRQLVSRYGRRAGGRAGAREAFCRRIEATVRRIEATQCDA